MAQTPSMNPDQDGSLPMFYKAPRPLDRQRDGSMGVNRPTDFSFAGNTNAIPILADEFPMAAAYYPIVFSTGALPVPAAVVGLQSDTNLFIDAEGRWQGGAYLPAYVRRYPFILMDDPTNKQYVLCIDDECSLMAEDGEFRLFEGEDPSEFTKNAMEFCAGLRQQGEASDEFVRALKEYDLLVPYDSQMEVRQGARLQLSGFMVIDPKKFDALPDNVLLQWRRKGWLGLIYAHMLSSHRWPVLVELMQARK